VSGASFSATATGTSRMSSTKRFAPPLSLTTVTTTQPLRSDFRRFCIALPWKEPLTRPSACTGYPLYNTSQLYSA
jgi:hypothetical protein